MHLKKQFFNYVIPSIGAMLVTGLYFVVDGIFVGRGVGTLGLAAINIAVPYISILSAITMMITMGGATLASIHFGKKEPQKAITMFQSSLLLVFIFSALMTLISFFFSKNLATLLGASNLLLTDTADYIKYFVMFGVFFSCSNTLSAFVRNDGNPHLAFWGMIIGALSNIFFDWLFIFPLQMGIKGAAIASGLGQIFACLMLLSHFFFKKGALKLGFPTFSLHRLTQILKTGLPEFVTQMSQPVVILCYNFLILKTFGEIGVSAFSVISYILVVVIGIFIGLAQGIQPLLSQSYGKGDAISENYFFTTGMKLNIFLAVIMYVIMLIFGKNIIAVFNHDPELITLAYDYIQVYGISFLFASINIVYTIYYLATKRTKQALLLSVLRSFVINTLCIFLIPALFGRKAIWAGIIVAEAIVTLVAFYLRSQGSLKSSDIVFGEQ
ncbi:MATE family efflux transporter [Vallitaleaceae bacterium 9-2]